MRIEIGESDLRFYVEHMYSEEACIVLVQVVPCTFFFWLKKLCCVLRIYLCWKVLACVDGLFNFHLKSVDKLLGWNFFFVLFIFNCSFVLLVKNLIEHFFFILNGYLLLPVL
jgi:hypothetical protein